MWGFVVAKALLPKTTYTTMHPDEANGQSFLGNSFILVGDTAATNSIVFATAMVLENFGQLSSGCCFWCPFAGLSLFWPYRVLVHFASRCFCKSMSFSRLEVVYGPPLCITHRPSSLCHDIFAELSGSGVVGTLPNNNIAAPTKKGKTSASGGLGKCALRASSG